MEFSRQEYWSGLPFPSPGDLPDPGIEPRSPALQADALLSELPGKIPPLELEGGNGAPLDVGWTLVLPLEWHLPPWCESILGLKVEAVQGKQVSLEWTEASGVSGNGGTTLEFLSPFLFRAPPLEMRRERREFFPDHAGKGSLLSS